jgi:hypothetical protein
MIIHKDCNIFDGGASLPYNMGCMLGGGNFHIVNAIIEVIFKDSPIDLYICRYTP